MKAKSLFSYNCIENYLTSNLIQKAISNLVDLNSYAAFKQKRTRLFLNSFEVIKMFHFKTNMLCLHYKL